MVCANGVFSQMKEQKSGKIINISSSTAFWGTPNFLHYVASKAALIERNIKILLVKAQLSTLCANRLKCVTEGMT